MSLYLVEICLQEWKLADNKVLDIVDVEINGDPGPYNEYVKLRAKLKYKQLHPELDENTYYAACAECVDDIVEKLPI